MAEEYIREKGLEEFNKNKMSVEPECPTHENGDDDDDDEMDILGDFVDIDLKPATNSRRRLKDDEASVNMRNNTGRITFNQTLSRSFKERGGYEYAALLHNKQGDVIIKLNDEKGVTVQDGTRTRENSNVVIHSLAFAKKLVDYLGIERNYKIVKLKEVAKTNDFVAYLVTNE